MVSCEARFRPDLPSTCSRYHRCGTVPGSHRTSEAMLDAPYRSGAWSRCFVCAGHDTARPKSGVSGCPGATSGSEPWQKSQKPLIINGRVSCVRPGGTVHAVVEHNSTDPQGGIRCLRERSNRAFARCPNNRGDVVADSDRPDGEKIADGLRGMAGDATGAAADKLSGCLLYTSPSPRD